MIPQMRSEPPWLRNELWRRARQVPAFDIDANDGPLPIDKVSGQNLTTFTRAASATFLDREGVIQTAGTNVLRRQWDATNRRWGWLVEEARTNSLRNNTMVGAVAGTPGTLPTNWTQTALASGLTRQIVGTGTSGGVTYIDIRISGTTADTAGWSLMFDANTQIAASSGQSWSGSAYIAIVGGSTANIPTGFLRVIERTGAGGYVTESNVSWLASTSALARLSATRASMGGTTGFVQLGVFFTAASGVAIDVTLRIGLPQLEQGAFATSVISTSGSAATRDADVWNWLSIPSVRSLYAEFTSPASGARGVASLNDNSANQRIALNTSGADPLLTVVDGGATQANIDAGTITANTVNRMAARFGANDFAASINGGAEVTDTAGTLPVVDRLFIGRSQAGEYLSGSLYRLVGFARPLMITQEVSR